MQAKEEDIQFIFKGGLNNENFMSSYILRLMPSHVKSTHSR
nr:MAG TPA: hypothetical protein [Caudoviricetes sp.]